MRIVTCCLDRTLAGMVVSLLALGLLAAPAFGGSHTASDPAAQTAKKKCKKSKKRAAAAAKKSKCKKKKPLAPVVQPPSGPGIPPPPPPPPPQTTYEKIDAAVAGGQITPEQGLIYKVFAAFGDARLPGQFVGVPDPLAEGQLDQVIAQWNQLSSGAQATLGPFLIPPFHQGSYWDQQVNPRSTAPRAATARAADPSRPWCDPTTNNQILLQDWHYLEATSGAAAGKVRIWYQDRYAATDAALAGVLMNALETKIWPSLTTLMQKEPNPDGGSTESCGGGSDAVDIALVDGLTKATTYASGLSQEGTSAKMIFPRAGSGGSAPFLAHEFMHMIQYAFTFSSGDMSSGENAWLKEGTAQWVQDYVSSSQYPVGLTPNQTEHQALQYFFPYPEKSLDSTTPGHHDYGSYVFWLWAVRKANDPTLVRQVWNAVASQKSINAAKSLFASGWAQAWKDFTKANWNKDPVTDYQGWDSITSTPLVAAEGTLPNDTITPVLTTVDPVAAKYLRFEPADDATALTYRNVGGLNDEAGVQAIIKYNDGSTATEDWTQIAQQDVPFCNIEELVLVLSNASVTVGGSRVFNLSFSPLSPTPRAATNNRAANVCIPDPQGGFSGTAHYDDTFTTVVDWSWRGNVDFEPNGQANPMFPEYFGETWDEALVESGSVTMSGNGTVTTADGDCTVTIPSAIYQLDSPGDGMMQIQPGPEPHYGIQLNFPGDEFPQGTVSCPDEDPYETFLPVPGLIYTPDPEQATVRGSYQGSATFGNEFFTQSSTWNFADP